ncbi:Putative uncharacterized protein [Halomonas sp. R57-5]|uniref:DUF2326 domain-containing protein n=1 Tax=Halomonas sp. R57-5 TaxID=1610576 RepID=UPI0005FC94EA|nr:DUF2326 domain-containing protein [Halomonas sp. R57-5]CEP36836.1 Putative uncharacterized protein [Halomonas sp. R57-5]
MKINKLYSEPKVFDPICFYEGFNLILGETKDGNVKTNGVGKSIAIDFISFGLLKRYADCRISLIPEKKLSHDTTICLDFEINGHSVISKRKIENPDSPTLIIDGKAKSYSRLSDAHEHINALLFPSSEFFSVPSFRSMMGPLIREEGSEFKSIIHCFDTRKSIPPDYTPHLFLLGIDPSPYVSAKSLSKELDSISKARKKMEENVTVLTGKNLSESKSELNELESQVKKIKESIDRLENIEGFDIVKNEIIDLENVIEKERATQSVLKSELSKLKLFRGENYIDSDEVAELYNQFQEGLGDLVKKSLDEVSEFKKKIDEFQRNIIEGRREELESELKDIEERVLLLDKDYKEKLFLLDQDGLLISLKQTIYVHEKKAQEFSALSSFLKKYSEYDAEHKNKKRERENEIYLLQSFVNDAAETIESFENTLLDMHQYIFGNRKSSFSIDVSNKKEILKFELRIDSDGSHSINREKVFLYDLGLLINPDTASRHPGFLVHDNIFDVDQDTLVKSINFIGNNSNDLIGKQYILTLNRDKLSREDMDSLEIDIKKYTRAAFTKENRFLKMEYQEI